MLNSLKSLGRNEQWSRYMSGGGYTDAVTVGKYKIETNETDEDIRYFIWNPKRPCVNMVIDKQDRTAVLDAVKYDKDCTIDGNMKRGEGTREMVDFSLALLKKTGATHVYLTDKSTINCNGDEIELGSMYFLKYGCTWYEKHFGFQPTSKFAKLYNQAKQKREKMLDTEFLSKQPCEFYTFDTVIEIFQHIGFVNFHSIAWVREL